ncbi:EF-hand domain-containing protein [Acaryochloris sp. IP29b_bin.137]|uniref:EF-hand domain-containing protein n=1 Tax=Acaryochloris sp. IP29b_bin.137 TaxID=2969217 RepID=UPI00262ED5A7|nr:EF-hand domain-containing protein [Acaryochloris sp. IP29b_bin.137]
MSNFKDLEDQFLKFAGDDRKLDLEEFQNALKLSNKYISERLFHIFDVDHTQGVNFQEFQLGIHRAKTEKLEFAFQLHDGNDDGYIDRQELAKFIRASLREANLDLPTEKLQQLRDILFEKADTNQDDEISLKEFKKLLNQSPRLQKVLSVNPEEWLKSPITFNSASSLSQENGVKRWHYLQNNWGKLLFLLLYFAVNVFLFFNASTSPKYNSGTLWLRVARGCGLALNFSSALILIPIMRGLMTRLRKTKLNDYLPIDEHIEFHKIIGHTIFFLAVIHTVAHLGNYSLVNLGFQLKSVSGPNFTGLLLIVLLLTMWVTSLPFVREKGNFDLFSKIHWAYIPWMGLLLKHGPHFRWWAMASITAYVAIPSPNG